MRDGGVTFGELLAKLLKDEGIERVSFAKMLGKSTVAVHKLLKDQNSPTIERASGILGCFGYELAAVKIDEDLPDSVIRLRVRDESAEEEVGR